MIVSRIGVAFQDPRGRIVDILQDIPLEHATIITSMAGSMRGNHYHKASTQYVFVISGRMEAFARLPGGPRYSWILEAGDLAINGPHERHALLALEDSMFLVLTHGPRGGDHYESDTFREDV